MANELKFGSKVVFLNGLPFTTPTAASDPGSAVSGDFYYNTTSNVLKLYNGSTWQTVSTTATAGTVTSVSLVDGDITSIFSIAGSPVTSSGTISLSMFNQSANTVLAGPTSGGIAQPSFRLLVAADIPALAYANQSLSNLTNPTSINQDLIPASTARSLGSSTFYWGNVFASLIKDSSGVISVDVINRLLVSPNGSTQLTWSNTGVQINSNSLNMSSNKIINLSAGSSTTDAVNYGQVILANGANPFTASQSLGGFTITNSGSPVSGTDLANKSYVDNLVQGISWKEVARSATTPGLPSYTYNNGTAGVGATITGTINGALTAQDGVTLVLNDRLLVKNETLGNQPYNGIYYLSQVGDGSHPYILTRTLDGDTVATLQWATVEIGPDAATQGGYLFREANDLSTIGTSNVAFTNISQGTAYTFTSGVQLSGSTVSANVDNITLDISSNQIEIKAGGVTNTQVSASAGIVYSKLNLTGSIVNADINASAAIAYTKLNLSNSIVNADINTSAAIAYSKLNLTGNIVNADINASAAIAYSKLAALTTNIVPVTDGVSGFITSSTANSVSLFSAGFKRGLSGSNVVTETYNDSTTLTDNQSSPQAVAAFQIAYASFAGEEITYVIETGTTNVDTRTGTLRIVANNGGTVISSISDTFTETADCGVTWSATISGANLVVSYTTTNQGANRTMRSDVKQFRR